MTNFRTAFGAIDRRARGSSQDGVRASALTPPPPGWKSVATDRRSQPLSTIRAALLVVAAGRGLGSARRGRSNICPAPGSPLIAHTLEALTAAWPFSAVTVVIHADDRALYDEALAHLTAGRCGCARAAGDRRRNAPAKRAGRARGACACQGPTSCSSTTPRGPFRRRELVARAVEAAIAPWRGGAGNAAQRHGQAGRRRGPGARHAAPREPARRADAAGVPLSAHPGGASARGGRGRRRPHRRRRGRRMGRRAGLCVRGRSGQPQGDDHAGYARRRGAAHRRSERDARRPGFRRPRLRARRPCVALRRRASRTPRR